MHSKRGNCSDREQISGCWGLRSRGRESYKEIFVKEFLGVMELFYILILVVVT